MLYREREEWEPFLATRAFEWYQVFVRADGATAKSNEGEQADIQSLLHVAPIVNRGKNISQCCSSFWVRSCLPISKIRVTDFRYIDLKDEKGRDLSRVCTFLTHCPTPPLFWNDSTLTCSRARVHLRCAFDDHGAIDAWWSLLVPNVHSYLCKFETKADSPIHSVLSNSSSCNVHVPDALSSEGL